MVYSFINSATGNIIGYLTLADNLAETVLQKKLSHERVRLAVRHRVYVETIFWTKKADKAR